MLLGIFEHQIFTGRMGEDITAHSARCEKGWVVELVCAYKAIWEMDFPPAVVG